jgi:hypothetical protein
LFSLSISPLLYIHFRLQSSFFYFIGCEGIKMKRFLSLIAAALSVAPFIVSATPTPRESDDPNSVVNRTKCAGKTFTYHGLVGYGDLPGNFTDKTGDTMSTGSSMAITGWKLQKGGKSYKATAYMLPDRGWCLSLAKLRNIF